jgi:hypothetical protein
VGLAVTLLASRTNLLGRWTIAAVRCSTVNNVARNTVIVASPNTRAESEDGHVLILHAGPIRGACSRSSHGLAVCRMLVSTRTHRWRAAQTGLLQLSCHRCKEFVSGYLRDNETSGRMPIQSKRSNEIIPLAFGLLLGAIAVAVAIAFGIGGRDLAAEMLSGWRRKMEKK